MGVAARSAAIQDTHGVRPVRTAARVGELHWASREAHVSDDGCME